MKSCVLNKNKKGWLIFSIVALLVIVAALIITAILINRERELDECQNNLIQTLENNVGNYDESSIMLTNTHPQKAKRIAEALGASLRSTSDGRFATLTLPEGTTILDVVKNNDNRDILDEISIDFSARILDNGEVSAPNYSVSDAYYELQTYLNYINMQAIWNITKGGTATIAIIDTGIDYDHPEFAGRISPYSYNASEEKIVKNCLLADGSYDFSILDDENGHGTAVAGIIAAAMDGEGIVGIAPQIEILVIKAEVDENGSFKRISDLVYGLYYAIEQDVSVVNMSFGTDQENIFKAPTKLAYDSDIICVAAAGNDASSYLTYPAAHEFVIGVGALAEDSFELADYSNYGENVDIVAPGTTYTTLPGGTYGYKTGTSMASPIVAATIALLQSVERYNEFETVKTLLYASSVDLGDLGQDWYFGYGALDVSALIIEPRGNITFDMMTDEVDDIETLFVRYHTLQNIPLPERLYAVFDGWYYDPQFTEEYSWYEDEFSTDLTLYAKWINEDDGLPFTYVIKNDGTVEITSYIGRRRFITVPDYIEGRKVSSIGDGAFKLQTELRIINLPSTLSSIGNKSFEACSQLVSITIPDSVTVIGEGAFYDCTRLSTINISDASSLTSIGKEAFKNCSRLLNFKITSNVSYCSEDAFVGCFALTSFEVSPKNTAYSAQSGALCSYDGTRLIVYPYGVRGVVTLPDVITTVGTYAFRGARCMSAVLTSVTEIENLAFYTAQITYITIPGRVSKIGDQAFEECASLSSVTIEEGVSSIPQRCFFKCISLKSIHIPASVQTVENSAFEYCNTLSSLTVSDNSCLTDIKSDAFAWCLLLTKVDFGKNSSLINIHDRAFLCTAISEIVFPESLEKIYTSAFEASGISQITFPEKSSLTYIGSNAFSKNGISELKLPESLTTLEVGAFAYNKISTVTVPKSVFTLGAAFPCCENLTEVLVDDQNKWYFDINGVVYNKSVTTLIQYPAGRRDTSYTVESGVALIDASAVAGTVYLESIILPNTLRTIGDFAFGESLALESINVPEGTVDIGAFAFSESLALEAVTLPSTLKTIGIRCFILCKSLKTLNLPDEIQEIGTEAFAYTDSLISLNIPKSFSVVPAGPFASCGAKEYIFHNEITEIKGSAFYNNYNLISVTIPDSVEKIGPSAFALCWRLYNISISEKTALQRLDKNALSNCGIMTFKVPGKISSMGQGVFEGCVNLHSVTFAQGSLLPYISAYMFDGATALRYITFEKGSALTSIQSHGFEGMTSLISIDFGDAVLTNIDNFAFRFCSSLETLTISEGVTFIGRYAFYGCSSLEQISLPESLEYIGRFAFLNTNSINVYFAGETLPATLAEDWDYGISSYHLGVVSVSENETFKYAILKSGNISIIKYLGNETNVDLNNTNLGADITVIGGSAFAYTDVETVVLPETLTTIQKEAFVGSDLSAIIIPRSVEFIGQNAFANTPITALTFDENALLKTIEQSAFENTANLLSVTIPSSVSTIGRSAFKNSGIREVVFADGCMIETISDGAFAYTKIASVDLPDTITLIDHNAFMGTSELKRVSFGENELMIMSNAFYNSGLNELTIPLNVTYIGEFAFTGLKNLTEFKVEEGHPYYRAVSGLLVSANGKTLISAPAGMTGSFTVPAEIEIIGFGAFEGSLLDNVYFSESSNILTFGHRAFYGAKNLKSIYVPDSVVSIDYYAFAECSSLKTVIFSEKSKLMGIYEGAFYACKSLNEIEIPDTIVEISDFAFYGCSSLNRIPISDNSQLLGVYSYSFAYSGIAGDFTPPSTLIDIGEYAFMGTKITSFTANSDNPWDLVIGLGAFEDCNYITTLNLDFLGEFIGSENSWLGYIFGAGDYVASSVYIPESLKTITISESFDTLYDYAFYGLEGIDEVVFSAEYITVYSRAFRGSDFTYRFLGTVTTVIDNGNTVAYACAADHFTNGIRGDLVLAEGVTHLYAFTAFEHLDSLTVPASVTFIDISTQYQIDEIKEIRYKGTLADWCNIDYIGDRSPLGQRAENLYTEGFVFSENLVIPEGVEALKDNFRGLNIKTITLPKTVTEIHEGFTLDTLTEVYVSADNAAFVSYDGIVYTKDYKEIVLVPEAIGGEVKLAEGLVEIPNFAFSEKRQIKKIKLPSTLVTIGDHAFYNCISLCEVVLPNSVSTLRDYAFADCRALIKITLSSSLTEIGENAFAYDSLLYIINNNSSLSLTHGSTDFGKVAEYAKLIVSADGTKHYAPGYSDYEYIKTADGLIFVGKKGSYQLIKYVGEEDTVVFPETINGSTYTISEFSGAKNVVLPSNMTSIPSMAFHDTSTLESVVLPQKLTSISMQAFYYCTKLDNLYIPESVVSINTLAFYECTSLNTIYIPDTMNEIQSYMFSGSPLSNIVVNSTHPTLVSFGNMVCTKDMEKIVFVSPAFKNVVVPKEIKSIGTAFSNSVINSVRFEAGSQITSIGAMAFQNCRELTYVEIPYGVTELGYGVFQNCSALTEIIIPETVKQLADGCFEGCSSLKTVNIPKNLTVLPPSTFSACSSLERIVIPANITEIGNGAFYRCEALKTVTISGKITKIGQRAFYECKSLESFVIGKELTEIGNSAFAGVRAGVITLHPENRTFAVSDGIIYNSDRTEMIAICTVQKNVVIPNTVTDIGTTFNGNTVLERITFESGSTITKIPSEAFNGCTSLKEIVLYEGITEIGSNAFAGCYNLTEINLPNSLKTIGSSAFAGAGLTSLYLGKNITRVGFSAFMACPLKKVTINSSFIVEMGAFDLCEISLIINNSNMKITIGEYSNGNIATRTHCIIDKNGNKTFAENMAGTDDGFVFKKTNGTYQLVSYIGESDTATLPASFNGESYSMYGFSGLKNVIIPEGFTSIDSFAFENSNVETVSFPKTLVNIEYSAFTNCRMLKGVDLSACTSELTLDSYAFMNCSSIEYVLLPQKVKTIGSGAFRGCTSLTSVDFSGLEYIGTLDTEAFNGCSALAEIKLPYQINTINSNVFDGTAYYNNDANWKEFTLYIERHMIRVREDATYNMYINGTGAIAKDCFEECYKLKRATIGGYQIGVLMPLTNVETVIVCEISPSFNFGWYFAPHAYMSASFPSTLKNIILLDTSYMTSAYDASLTFEKYDSFFGLTSGFTIFVTETKQALGWDENFYKWYAGNNVYYGDKWIFATFMNPDGTILTQSPVLTHQIIRVPWTADYYDEDNYYVFLGYDIDGDGVMDTVPATSTFDVTATPIYEIADKCDFGIHNNSWVDGVAPTCGSNGMIAHYHCDKCGVNTLIDGSVIDNVIIENTSHVYTDIVYEPTCTSEGYTLHVCSCSDEYIDSYVGKTPHNYRDNIYAPTCSSEGYTVHTCIHCSDSYTDSFTATVDHTYAAWYYVGNVCTDVGENIRDCIFCDAYESVAVGPLGHNIVHHDGKPSTDTVHGHNPYETCTRCDYSTYEELPLVADKSKFISAVKRLEFLTDTKDRFNAILAALRQYQIFTEEEKLDSEVQSYYQALLEAIEAHNALMNKANSDFAEASGAMLSALPAYNLLAGLAILLIIKKFLSDKH